MTKIKEEAWTQIEDYIESLLKDGKRSQHEDFQTLFRILPKHKERIILFAKEYLKREKGKYESSPL